MKAKCFRGNISCQDLKGYLVIGNFPNTPQDAARLDIFRRHVNDDWVGLVYLPPHPPSYQPAQRVRRSQGRQVSLEESAGP